MAESIKKDPTKSVKEVDEEATKKAEKETQEQVAAFMKDKIFYRQVAGYLTLIVLLVVVGGVILIGIGKSPSDGIIAIGSGAVGALIGIFSTQKS